MKMMKKGYGLSVILCMMLALTSCSNNGESSEETPYYSVNIDGVKEYRPEEDETVKEIKEHALGYVELTCNINYKSMEHALEELDFYTEGYKAQYQEFGYIESAIETAEYYEQVMETVEANITSIQFYEFQDAKRAWVECEYVSVVSHATEEYFNDVGIKKDTKYKRTMTLGFEEENGKWMIGQYDISDREEVL